MEIQPNIRAGILDSSRDEAALSFRHEMAKHGVLQKTPADSPQMKFMASIKTGISRSRNLTLFLIGAAWISTECPAQNLVPNGDFESPGYSSPPFYRYLANPSNGTPQLGAPLPGWTVLDDGILEPPYLGKLPRYANVVHHGSYGIALNQGSGIRTTFPADKGFTYQLEFWLRLQGSATPMPLQVSVAGIITNFPVTAEWTHHLMQFSAGATDTESVLQFDNISPIGTGLTIGLDEISLLKCPRLEAVSQGELLLDGSVGSPYRIDYLDPLLEAGTWQTLTNLSLPSSRAMILDEQSTNSAQRFYRAVDLR